MGEGPSPIPRMAPTQWTASAQCFAQHMFSQVTNFWRQGRPASLHIKSLDNGQAEMSLMFQLPHPSEIIPPPSPYSTNPLPTSIPRRPGAPTPLPKRPIIPLFPPGQAPKLKQRKSPVKQPTPQAPAPPAPAPVPALAPAQAAQVTQATPSHSQPPPATPNHSQPPPGTRPTPPLPLKKRPRPSPASSPATTSQRLRRDFGLQEEGSESENEPPSPKPLTPQPLRPPTLP